MTVLAHVQARTYDTGDLSPDSHQILGALADVSRSREQYEVLSRLVRYMLHPDVCSRATIDQALQSQVFAGC